MGRQKNATPSKEQQKILQMNGLLAHVWVVVKELNHATIVKHRITGEFKVLDK